MTDLTAVGSTSLLGFPAATQLAVPEFVYLCQILSRAEWRNLLAMCHPVPLIEEPITLPLGGQQDLSSPMLKHPELKPVFQAVIVANHFFVLSGDAPLIP